MVDLGNSVTQLARLVADQGYALQEPAIVFALMSSS